MDLDSYQKQSKLTVITTDQDTFVYGLIAEIGEVFSAYKKFVRQGRPISELEGTPIYKDMVEQVGDVLWYLAAVARTCNVKLSDAAEKNLSKTNRLFGRKEYKLFDQEFPEGEKFPLKFEIEFRFDGKKTSLFYNGSEIGDKLDSNSHIEDEYRFHDVFHLAYAACLGWSPVFRKLMTLKRKSDADIDRIEDGARAMIIEEAISAMVFESSRELGPFHQKDNIPIQMIVTIINMAKNYEVGERNVEDWILAITKGFEVFDAIKGRKHAIVVVDVANRNLWLK